MERLLSAAQRAYDEVAFYRMLYPRRPCRKADIPFISYTDYHHAYSVLDCITGLADTLGAVPAYNRMGRRLPVTPLESGDEWNARQRRLVAGLALLGLPVPERQMNFLLLADDTTGPFACELSSCLGWVRHRASIRYIDGRHGALEHDVEAFDPDAVLIVTPQISPSDLAGTQRRIVAVTHVHSEAVDNQSCDRLLVCDELHVVAARPAGTSGYCRVASDLLFEHVPGSGHAAVTTMDFTCLPLIRYSLGRHLELAPSAGG